MRITRWRDCSCGRPFRTYKHHECPQCRDGYRLHRLAQRKALRDVKARNLAVKAATEVK